MPAKGQKSQAQPPKPKRICRVIGCENEANKPGSARGLCLTHYGIWLRNGKSEIPVIKPPEELPPLSLPVRPRKPRGPGTNVSGSLPMELDLALVERSAQIGCTDAEIISLLDIAPSTFYSHLKNDPELRAALDWGRETGKATLRRLQWQGAESGNPTMLIWLGKNMLDQTDKLENSGTVDNRLKVIVEFVGDPAPAIEHEKPQQRFTPRLVGDVEFKG